MPRWGRELLGWTVAAAIAIAAVAVVAASPRSELLFRDGDSLVTTLVVHSLAIGQPQDWAMSSVLFLPEIAVLWMLSLLGLGINATLALAGVVNVLALYGALRVAAGSALRARAPIAGALLGLTGFALLAATEGSASRDALELASLLTTTTYYSATVVAAVLGVGLARRAIDRNDVSRGTPVAWGLVVTLALVAAASVLTNPLFAAWATVPLGAVLVVVAWRRADVWWMAGALVTGSIIGYLARMPLAHLIANTGAGYIDPSQWRASLDYYGVLLADRWSAPWGAASLLLIGALWAGSIAVTRQLAARRRVGAAIVAACGWVMPLLVIVGAVVLGTHAARYLQPAVFAPLLTLTVLPALLPDRLTVTRLVPAVGTAAVALVAAAGLGIPSLVAAATAPDADLDCVVRWTEDSGRTGGGQFWTVRLPKTHLADPRGLVQLDHQLRGYAWLMNRDDFAVGEVSFLVMDDQSPAFELPAGVSLSDAEMTACGRYTIADFGDRTLPIGPLRS
ncbi:hypothetical protein IF188_05445 [Microbacterium sp. NEAU-LLC]|uniref:Glycosyltransferase RgtA/B/C/D-like domain-containing protein n=1 Tax=Microbacterium helvum TaxID=2773713 RepID=A0ABR8NMI9_9MICO|nr:hypothetical protein [Microbacterium helvum]